MLKDIMNERYTLAMKRFEQVDVQNPITHALIKNCFAKRPQDAYKGNCGRLFVCAGSTGLTGAAIMACQSALRCGCGLITLGCAQSLNNIFEIRLTEVMTLPLESEDGVISFAGYPCICKKMNNSDAFLFGPGLSGSGEIQKLMQKIAEDCAVPLIIDADGLNALSKDVNILQRTKCPVILTPHVGEFSRLIKKDTQYILNNLKPLAAEFASKYKVTLVLKSHRTLVAGSDGETYENVLGGPAMATGGTGDVLAGAIASLAAQGADALMASLAGVYIHSLAADMAVLETGEYSLIPSDIIEYIKYAVRETSYRS